MPLQGLEIKAIREKADVILTSLTAETPSMYSVGVSNQGGVKKFYVSDGADTQWLQALSAGAEKFCIKMDPV